MTNVEAKSHEVQLPAGLCPHASMQHWLYAEPLQIVFTDSKVKGESNWLVYVVSANARGAVISEKPLCI